MDATTVGSILAGVGVLATAVVAYLGKRGESATARFNSVTDQVQEERDGLRIQVAAKDTQLVAKDVQLMELHQLRLADQVEIARLRVRVIELGGGTP